MTARPLILGTAGHIDHGKTALVRALTGIDTDRWEEEKRRGISIDIGFAHLEVGDRQLGIIDVPGHERFIRNMLAGASGIDLALLVIAADDSVMPQTREHLAILELLQIKQGLIALTKSDLAEPSWLELVEEDIRELVRGTFLDDAPIVRTSATTGEGIEALKTTLVECSARIEQDETGDHFRLAVDRAFVLQGLGTVVTGTVFSGTVHTGDELALLPGERSVRVRSLQSHGRDVDSITKGQRAAINVMGVHHTDIERGCELATPGYLKPSRRLTVHLRALPDSPWPIRHRGSVRLHIGTQELKAEIRLIGTNSLTPGQQGFAQIITTEPVVASGRQPFVIRSESPQRTIGGGQVLLSDAPRLRRNDPSLDSHLNELGAEDDLTRAGAIIHSHGSEPWTTTDLCRDAKLTKARAEEIIAQLESDGTLVSMTLSNRTERGLHRDVLKSIETRIMAALRALHEEFKLERAVPRRRLSTRLNYLPEELVLGIADRMIEHGRLSGDEQTFSLPEFKPTLTEAQNRQREAIIAAYKDGGFSPPDPGDLARQAGVNVNQLRPILDLCVSERHLVHVEGSLFLHADWHRELQRRITDALTNEAGMTLSDIRKMLDTSRKYAVPLCEHLDRIGLTRRQGDVRVLKEPAG